MSLQVHCLQYTPAAAVSGSPNLVFINVSPIEYGHVLLVRSQLTFATNSCKLYRPA